MMKEGEASKLIFAFFQNFGSKISSMPKILEKITLPPLEYNAINPSYYGELFSSNSEIKIRLSDGKIEKYSGYLHFIMKEKSRSIHNPPLYSKIFLNSLNQKLYDNYFIQTVLNSFLEIKINQYMYKDNEYSRYICKKCDINNKSILHIDKMSNNIFDNFFYYNEIEIEMSSVNDLLFENISNIINSFDSSEYEALNKTIIETTKRLNSYYMLNTLGFFNMVLNAKVSLGSDPMTEIKNENFHPILLKGYKLKSYQNKKGVNIIKKNNNINSDNALFKEIKKELELKEKKINRGLYRGVTHLYINDKTMKKEEIASLAQLINQGVCKMFAWSLNSEETKKFGIKNFIKVGNIPSLNNLNIYIII